jgi:hypothetical protein
MTLQHLSAGFQAEKRGKRKPDRYISDVAMLKFTKMPYLYRGVAKKIS